MSIHYILLLNPSAALQKTVEEAVKKLAGIQQIKVTIDLARTALEMAKLIDQGRRFEAIIIEQAIESIEVNYILGLFRTLKRRPPLLLSKPNYEALAKRMLSTQITPALKGFSREFVYDYLNETLLIGEKKIDTRIIKEVMSSATSVIAENTQVKLEVLGLNEITSKDFRQEMSSVIAFIGDSVLGTLNIATTNRLVSLFCQKMLYCEESDVTPAMRTDVLNELSNQILGAFRIKLSQNGYELGTSMQMVVSGDKPHLYQTKSVGHYYRIKLKHGEDDFFITFAYGSYHKQKGEANFDRSKIGNLTLDVRLVNSLTKAVGDVISLGKERAIKVGVGEQKGDDYEAESIHILHGRGHQGSFLVALEIPRATIALIIQESMGIKKEGITPEIINDVCAELTNQLSTAFKAQAQVFGYQYLNVLHGGFCASDKLHYLLKNQGLYCRLNFTLRNQPFTVCFGMEAGLSPKIYDLWSYIKSLSQSAKALLKNKGAPTAG